MYPSRFKFNKRQIDSLPATPEDSRSRETEYSDEASTGLRLIVNRQGRKRFLFRYTYLGKKRSLQIGEFGPIDINAARLKVSEFKRLLADDIDPKQQRDEARAILNFKEFGELHYMPYAKVNKRSFRNDQSILEKHIYPVWGEKRLTEVSQHDVQKFLDKIGGSLKPASINRILSLVHRMFKLSVEWNFAPQTLTNPAAGIRKLKENNQRERFLTKAEFDRFLAACDAEESRTPANAIKLAVLSGMRIGEILSAQWCNLKIVDGRGSLYLPHTKSGFSRTVLLNDAALEVVTAQKAQKQAGNPFMFPSKLTGKAIHRPKKAFVRIKNVVGNIDDLRIHDLRHTFASIIINLGATLYEVQYLLGHHNPQTSTRYSHLSTDRLREVSGRMSKLVKGEVTAEPESVEDKSEDKQNKPDKPKLTAA